jgi:FixJ family two-component response regulator
MNTPSATVFVVDDDAPVRDALRMLLRSAGHAVEVYASAQEFLAAYSDDRPGCLLLDVRMPGMSGLELQERLNERHAILPIVFITGHGDVPMAVEAMQAGAMDFLQKPFRDDELLDRIGRALDRDAGNRRELLALESIVQRFDELTPRERAVMELMVQGKPNKIIAADLGISQRTVEIHRARVMEKTQAGSLAHLVRMSLRMRERE